MGTKKGRESLPSFAIAACIMPVALSLTSRSAPSAAARSTAGTTISTASSASVSTSAAAMAAAARACSRCCELVGQIFADQVHPSKLVYTQNAHLDAVAQIYHIFN